jgi:hypothetical protein
MLAKTTSKGANRILIYGIGLYRSNTRYIKDDIITVRSNTLRLTLLSIGTAIGIFKAGISIYAANKEAIFMTVSNPLSSILSILRL